MLRLLKNMFKRCTCGPPSDIMGRFREPDCPKHGWSETEQGS